MENNLISTGEDKFSPEKIKHLDNVKQVIYSTMMEFHNYDFPKYIQNYKKYLGFVADRMKDLEPWQSNVSYPLVASTIDTMFGNLFDFWYEFWINESKLKKACNEAFDFRGSGKTTFKEATKEALITGKAYTKDYLIRETKVDKFFDKEITTEIKTPSMHYISVFDVMYDRSRWLSESPFKIIRTFTTWESIKHKVLPLILQSYPKERHKEVRKQFDEILKKYKDTPGSRFSMYDYNPVKSLTATTQFYNSKAWDINYTLPNCQKSQDLLAWYNLDWTLGQNAEKNNYFLSANQSNYELVEYTTCDEKIIYINGNLIYSGPKPFSIWDIHEINYSMIPGTGNANGVADDLGNLQDINESLWNAFIDNIKLILGPMFAVSGNLPIWKSGTLDFKKFKAIRTNGASSIEKIQLGVTDFAPINFMQMTEGLAEKRSATGNYITGGGGSIERVSGGIDMKFNQYKSKLSPITDSIDQMMGNIARNWVTMFFKFYTKEELAEMDIIVEEVTKPDANGVQRFDTFTINKIDIRKIIDERQITFTYNSLDKLTKENSRKTIMESLPAMLQYTADQVNMQELMKVLAWQDFDPDKIIKQKQPVSTWWNQDIALGDNYWYETQKSDTDWKYDQQYMKGSSKFMPDAPFNPQDTSSEPQAPVDQTQLSDEELIAELSKVTA